VPAASAALARRALRDARTRTLAFAYLFAIYAYIQPAAYRHSYPTRSDRLGFAHSFGPNKGLRLFYGEPHDLLSVGGYSAWRVGGTLAIVAAAFGLLAAVRALRTEEDTGRMELVLAGAVGRGTAFAAAMAAIAAGVALLWLAQFAGFVLGGLPAGGSAYLALATTLVAPVFVGVGAVAFELGGAAVGLALLLRVIADTVGGAGWLRWITPLGWAEEMRPFVGAQPWVVVAPLAATALLLALAARIAIRRDIGTGLLTSSDTAEPKLGLLSSPTALALRGERAGLGVWIGSIGLFSLILGVISKGISAADISPNIQRELARFGAGSIVTPAGYLGFVFVFFVLAVSLFACAQIGAARHEEAEERLETLLSLPVARGAWLGGRLTLAVGATLALSLVCGVLTWVGASAAGVSISLAKMLEAGLNCVPVAVLFLGVAALAFALAPRASSGIAYGLVTVTFLWQLVGSLVGAPKLLVELTPFAHVGLVPAQAFRVSDALAMTAIGLVGCAAALVAFRRRDLIAA